MPLRAWFHQWGSTAEERARPYPATELLPDATVVVHRGIDVQACAADTYRWVCQMKVAPYSYDWVDNWGRQSPRSLTPGADEFEVGDRFIAGFQVAAFEPGRSLTLRAGQWLYMSYEAVPVTDDSCRLVCALTVKRNAVIAEALVWGDLVMMRKQLRTFKGLAEQKGRSVGTDPSGGAS